MTTKNDHLFIRDQSFVNENRRISENANNENQYSNLNLNQNRQCSNVSPIHSNSRSYNNKSFVSENYEKKKKSQSMNKFSKTSNFSTVNTEVKESAKKLKKNGTSNAINNSTLSLHISAYENSIEPENDLENIQKEELKKKKSFIIDTLFFNGLPTFIQNQFEFPRQQENEESKKPEAAQFKASQTLLNPNKTYMNKSVFRVPGTSASTENGSTNDTGNNELNNEYGPDTEFVTTCRRMFSSPRRSSNEVSLQTKLPSTSKATKETGIIVPVNPSSRRLSFEEDTTNGIRLGEIISASILELFFSTLPPTQQDKIRTLFIDVLNCAGVTQSNVFSKVYEQTRLKMTRMMHENLARTFLSLKLSTPMIDDKLAPVIIAQKLTRYSEDFEELKEIGAGGFGKVYQSRSKVDGQLYAIKKIPLKKTSDKAYQKMLEECRCHARLQHPNIVRYHNAWVDLSYKSTIRLKPPNNLRTVRIETLSTASSSLPSSSTPHGVTIEEYESDNNLEDEDIESDKNISDENQCDEEEVNSSSSSSSSDGSKRKGFWAKKQLPNAGHHSFSSFDTTENGEDDDNESVKSDDSIESKSAMKLGKVLAKIDVEKEIVPNDLQLAIDIPQKDLGYVFQIGYPTLFIQMELCHITLEQYIQNREKQLLSVDPSFNEIVAEGLLSAIEFLHRNNVVHRDIKPSNIFLKYSHDKKPIIMLGDFGLARSIVEELALGESMPSSPLPEESGSSSCNGNKLTSGLGTYLYAAPEQLNTKEYSLSADIYSAGVVIYELYHDFKTGSERIVTLQELRKRAELSAKFKQAWPELCPILSSMITKSPKKRLEAGILLTKFKQLKEKMCHESEIQRLLHENQKLRDEAIEWKEKYLELERKLQQSQQILP